MKRRSIIFVTLVAATLCVPTAAHATDSRQDAIEVSAGEPVRDASERATNAELHRLAGTQSKDEIDRLKALGLGTAVLVDGDTGEELAAVHTEPDPRSARALSILGPGCSLTSTCMKTADGVPRGYTGTGTMTMSIPGVVSFAAGDRDSSIKTATGTTHTVKRTLMIHFALQQTAKAVTRS